MMTEMEQKQFRLQENGEICFQENPTNPLPGEPLARLKKGEDILKPGFILLDHPLVQKDGEAGIQEKLATWMDGHLKEILEPLMGLRDDAELKEPAKDITRQVHAGLGIVPREQLEASIAKIDQDDRRDLRAKKVRLGPILVFIPALNKPAAVRLRGLLWCLFNGKDLPAQCPNDGIVSCVIDAENIDKGFYQSIGYPVYGKRAIRIDMLDRVINAVYDKAKDGKFQAQHEMAEWLGCPIGDLYDILEAMGHKKIHDPADEKPDEEQEAQDGGVAEVAEKEPEEKKADERANESGTEKKPAVQVKPELATFRLKKGKAFQAAASHQSRPKPKAEQEKQKRQKKPKKLGKKEHGLRVIETGPKPKPEDSPFAVLEQLKSKNDS